MSDASDQIERALDAHDTEALRKLLQRGVDPNIRTQDLDVPALSIALSDGDEPSVRLLAQFGADVELLDDAGRSALSRAAAAGDNNRELKTLIGIGAMVDSRDRSGWTALHFASTYEYTANVALLLAAGAGRNLETHDGLRAVDLVERNLHPRTAAVLREQS